MSGLSLRALVNYGLEDELFPAAGLSRTPQKSMQARLSIDILNNDKSPFVRTSRGRFYLRELLAEQQSNDPDALKVYRAERRVPVPSSELVLCIPRRAYERFLQYQGIGNAAPPNPLLELGEAEVSYIPRSVAETDDAYKQIVTYTVIQYQSKILTFRRGLYNRAAKFLRGAQCVGFGGHVSEDDRDLFSLGDLGIRQNAAREISEELMLPNGRPHVNPDDLEFLGILNDDSSDVGVRHMAVVLRYWVDDWSQWKSVGRGEVSINKIKWLDTLKETINLSEFEYWSQLVLREFFKSSMEMVPSYKIQRKSIFHGPHVLCVVGSIGSGKSATSNLLRNKFRYTGVNSGQVLARLMEMPPVPDTPRDVFQSSAEVFITRPDGPNRLGQALAEEVTATQSDRVLIDGIRHPETLEALKQYATLPVALLYVYTPPDVAFEMYRDREGHNENDITFPEFIKLYAAPVESKIRYMTGDADIIIFNWLGLDAYERALSTLMGELNAR
ncbi:DNA mismatch repair protein MutT [Brucella sp. 10RB9214]|nr:DNA mismatch repair protein MutT [Brucella sp. 10RB9212]MRN51252.1 DNA mismatch repair protein MutT [Brucella sp. 10RB9214]